MDVSKSFNNLLKKIIEEYSQRIIDEKDISAEDLENIWGEFSDTFTLDLVNRKMLRCKYIFKKTHVYRVLIGLTNNNNYVVTHFPEYNIGKKINYGDMIAFDFDKTLHEVINIDNKQVSPRILLKLHFLVCEEGELSENYLHFIKKFYTGYDRFLRIYTKIGTDPKYLYEFIIGLSCHFMYYPNIEKIICLYFILFYGFIKFLKMIFHQ